MKNLKFLFSISLLITVCMFTACHKEKNTPVTQIVNLLDEATKKAENVKDMDALTDVKNIISPEDVWNVIRDNSNYPLTEEDKEKLKKSYNKFLDVAYDKTSEYIPSDAMKRSVKNQLKLIQEAINKSIDKAETLGQIRAVN